MICWGNLGNLTYDKLVQIAPISLWLMLLVTHEIKATMSLILLFHYGSNWGL